MTKSNTWSGPLQEVAGSQDAPDISIVIVSWNTRDLLLQCLRSIQDPAVKEDLRLEMIVVDNASKDGSAEAAKAIAGVRILPLRRNFGYGRANNIGLEKASGRYILILNADTILLPGCLKQMKEFADRKQGVGIVSPRLLNQDGTIQEAAFRFPSLAMAAMDLFPLPLWVPGRIRASVTHSALNGRYGIEQIANKPYMIDHPLGACMMLRREAYRECGGFDPRIFMYSEEIDLALRYANAGWECWQVPQARVVHLGGRSTSQVPVAMQRELWRSRLYLYRKHRSRLASMALAVLLVTAQFVSLLAVTFKRLAGRLTPDEAARRRRLAHALIQVALSR
ncbi:MAG: glycosyltransferase family 2 protein [Chloroflexota bacterium]|nr:glycosyltransferase family 2 protein [Chloroflexota bacterium]